MIRKIVPILVAVVILVSLVAIPAPVKAQQEGLVPVCIPVGASWRVILVRSGLQLVLEIFPGSFVVDAQHPCPPVKTRGFEGPGIPQESKNTQAVEICDGGEMMFDRPGGQSIGQRMQKGTTFYVIPKPVQDQKGDWWVQIWFGSYSRPWVEYDCIQYPGKALPKQ